MTISWTKLGTRSAQGVTTALTEAAPSGNTGDGVDLSGVDSVCVSVDAPAGQTLSGGGSLLAYRYSYALGGWKRAPEFDLDLSDATGLSLSAMTFAPREVRHKSGRVAWIPSSVTVSGGTALTITIEAAYGSGGLGQ